MSYDASEFKVLLDASLPGGSYRKGQSFGGKAVWTHRGDAWTLEYATSSMGPGIGCVTIKDEGEIVDITLFGSGVDSVIPVLKAVGAIPY